MLKWLHIRNLALVSEADIELSGGFNVITGETGAGKSVMMGGLSLLLGARFDKSSIRTGETRCEISGEFALSPDELFSVNPVLEELGFETISPDESKLLIRRVFTSSGNRNFLNASPAGAQSLKQLGALLADIHTPGEALGLMKRSEQLGALDRFAHLAEPLAACAASWKTMGEAKAELDGFLNTIPSADEACALRRTIAEIENQAPRDGEDSELESRHSAAANSRMILEISAGASAAISEADDSVCDKLSSVHRLLRGLENADPEYAEKFLTRCDEISSELSELSSDIADRASSVEMDESAFAALEERMRILQTLKRKYGPELSDVLSCLDHSRQLLDAFENAEHRKNMLKEALLCAEKKHLENCAVLSSARKKEAKILESKLRTEIVKLGFKRAAFEIVFDSAEPGPSGSDRIDFLFSANPGVPPKLLRDVASSGELARVMLGVKTVLSEADRIGTLVFDEIDANIGGETAVTVAGELALLGKKKQILCISHLPQVAARADRHFVVEKVTTKDTACSRIEAAEGAVRVMELGRMLGGDAPARKHAETLLAGASGKN